ncbi:MAG: Gfo/Idh/MocA family oxidoreductase [Acidobacteria bacterium]|nr:Gfo/Idh/MocA family oxidoreductase [Acidobacteriota bacterium]
MANEGISRRHFFFGTLLAGLIPRVGFGSVPSLKALGYQSPNEKLNIAGIGAGAQAFSDLRQCETENIVALADVDWVRGVPGFERYDKATKYKDFRQMLDKEGKSIDAVVIGIPDHMHTFAALWCMERGKSVYVEKPLTRIASEARLLRLAAQKYKVATQMGNQGYSHEATRVASEIIWAGEIGAVTEVHAWMSRPSWPQGMTKTPPPTPVPSTLDWDIWLGTAAARPFTTGDQEYKDFVAARSAARGRGMGGGGGAAPGAPGAGQAGGPPPGAAGGAPAAAQAGRGGMGGGEDFGFYLPFNWRGFYDFGSSLIGDWGVHILGPANWALGLSPENLISVECIKKDPLPPFTFPDVFTIKYEFKARKGMPPVTVYWYQHTGGDAYIPSGMTVDEARKVPNTGPQVGPANAGRAGAGGRAGRAAAGGGAPGAPGAPGGGRAPQGSGYNCIFVGSKGYLGTSGRGEGVGLLPGSRWADYTLPPAFLTRSPGHQRDWIRACKGGAPACSQFEIAAPYTEWLVLGSAAVRVDGKLLYDAQTGLFTNSAEANKHLQLNYRRGWEVKL